MKMTTALVLLFSISSIFSGGISVGSGQGKTIVGLSLKGDFQKESDLMLEAEYVIQEIMKGQSKRLNTMKTSGHCDHDFYRVDELDVAAYYPIEKDGLDLKKEYVGYLTIELKDCKKPANILDDNRFGWDELWD